MPCVTGRCGLREAVIEAREEFVQEREDVEGLRCRERLECRLGVCCCGGLRVLEDGVGGFAGVGVGQRHEGGVAGHACEDLGDVVWVLWVGGEGHLGWVSQCSCGATLGRDVLHCFNARRGCFSEGVSSA